MIPLIRRARNTNGYARSDVSHHKLIQPYFACSRRRSCSQGSKCPSGGGWGLTSLASALHERKLKAGVATNSPRLYIQYTYESAIARVDGAAVTFRYVKSLCLRAHDTSKAA